MFDDRTYDNIMEEMLDNFGGDVNTDDGSLAFNACAKIAEKLEDTYGDMDAINDNMSPDTMDLEHLINYGKTQRGIDFRYATAPVVRGEFKQDIEIGQQFVCNDFTYTVTERIDGYTYKLECDTEGAEANKNYGDLYPVDYIDDYQGGKITETLTDGMNDEDIEVFRARVISSFNSSAFCGNKADYRREINKMTGVGGCKPKRREKGSPWIYITIIGSDYGVPSQKVLTDVQTAIDPEQNHGEGDGLAPICHSVIIQAVTEVAVYVSTKITIVSGHSSDTLKGQIDEAVKEYLMKIRQEWEKAELNNQYVRISQIDARLLAIDGIEDVLETKINDVEENLVLSYEKIPVFGGVTIV